MFLLKFSKDFKENFLYCLMNLIVIWQITYSTFLNFNNSIPSDIKNYIGLSKNLDFIASPHQSFRIGIPVIAKFINQLLKLIPQIDKMSIFTIREDFSYHLSFYFLNLLISTLIFFLIYSIFKRENVHKYLAILLIYLFQLNTTYLNMVAFANIDLIIIFFITLSIFITEKNFISNKSLITIYFISFISIFFKEYIYIILIPIILSLINKIYSKLATKLICILFYSISLSFFTIVYRKIFNFFTLPNSDLKYINYIKGDFSYLLNNFFQFKINFNSIQNFIQYSPILILVIFCLSLLNEQFRKYVSSKGILIFFPLCIFIVLTGIAGYPSRVFFPFYTFILIILPKSNIWTRFENKI